MKNKGSLRQRLGAFIAGAARKDYVPSLRPIDDLWGDGRTKTYALKSEQISANVGWSFAANDSISSLCAAVPFKLYKKKLDGDKEEITNHPILKLLNEPNNAHTGRQLRKLHYTYVNFTGESYIYMTKGTEPFLPGLKKLPDALQIFESHLVQFKLEPAYSKSIVKFANHDYPVTAFIRDINPNPANPYNGQSVISAAAATIDLDEQMKDWNRNLIANGAKPSLIFTSNEEMSDESYARWKQQFSDENTGAGNAGKPLLIEGGDAKPFMMTPSDLDFLGSRKFSKEEVLAMWKTPDAVLGMTANFNRANMDAALYMHILFNVVPRVTQFVEQLNQSLVHPFDPSLELSFENPVPEDVEAKLKLATQLTNKVYTIDEVREMYGEEALPDHLGEQIYMPGTNVPLSNIADGTAQPQPAGATDPNASDGEDPNANPNDPNNDPQKGQKKKT